MIRPGHAYQAASGIFPGSGGEEIARGGENAEAAAGRLGPELDDLGVVADRGDRAAEGGAGDAVAAEVEASADRGPAHGVEEQLAVETVVEELPFRRDGHRRSRRLRSHFPARARAASLLLTQQSVKNDLIAYKLDGPVK